MSASVSPAAQSSPVRSLIALSRRQFIAVWWLFHGVHVACIAYSVGAIRLHLYFMARDVVETIYLLGLSVINFFDFVILAHGLLVVCHALSLLQSVTMSLYYCQWCFKRPSKALQQMNDDHSKAVAAHNTLTAPSCTRALQRGIRGWHSLWTVSFGRYGMFSVEGTHYDETFFAMEVVEIALQIFQTYKLSSLVPRVWINRLNAAVLILDCWSTAFLHKYLHGDRLTKRIILLVVDGIFDVVSSMVIPLVVIHPYYTEFNATSRAFPLTNYYSDVWLIQAISENRQVFVTSWIDYVSKMTPRVTVIVAMEVIKQYLVMDSPSHTHEQATPKSAAAVVPSMPSQANSGGPHQQDLQRLPKTKCNSKWQHLLLFLSGLAVLVIHIHATTVAALAHTRGCLLGVRPWFTTLTTCIALEINCANGEFADGSDLAALDAHVEKIVPSALRSLVFASCSQLHVPSVVQQFRGLQMIKIYNSTVVKWDASAELREDLHPDLQLLYVSDSNFSRGGELPVGLLGNRFPYTLRDIEFSGTNVVTLPSNLHEIWPTMLYFVLERNAGITEYPEVVVKMKPQQLFLNSNGITRIPDGLLADQAFRVLHLNGNPLQEMPDTLGDISALRALEVSSTAIKTLPRWATAQMIVGSSGRAIIPELGYLDVFIGGTLLCDDRQQGDVARATAVQWVHLLCNTRMGKYAYPIEEERKWRAASLANMS